jgi:hypothetical protein
MTGQLGGIGGCRITSALSLNGCHGYVTLFAAKRGHLRRVASLQPLQRPFGVNMPTPQQSQPNIGVKEILMRS